MCMCVCEWTSQVFHVCAVVISLLAVSQGVGDKVERDAAAALLKQQATAAPATDNRTHHAVEHVITYPSRLIYYLNEDSESTYHDLDTRAKNQAAEGQVRRRSGRGGRGRLVRERGQRLILRNTAVINSRSLTSMLSISVVSVYCTGVRQSQDRHHTHTHTDTAH